MNRILERSVEALGPTLRLLRRKPSIGGHLRREGPAAHNCLGGIDDVPPPLTFLRGSEARWITAKALPANGCMA
jgi:hypothetical protein